MRLIVLLLLLSVGAHSWAPTIYTVDAPADYPPLPSNPVNSFSTTPFLARPKIVNVENFGTFPESYSWYENKRDRTGIYSAMQARSGFNEGKTARPNKPCDQSKGLKEIPLPKIDLKPLLQKRYVLDVLLKPELKLYEAVGCTDFCPENTPRKTQIKTTNLKKISKEIPKLPILASVLVPKVAQKGIRKAPKLPVMETPRIPKLTAKITKVPPKITKVPPKITKLPPNITPKLPLRIPSKLPVKITKVPKIKKLPHKINPKLAHKVTPKLKLKVNPKLALQTDPKLALKATPKTNKVIPKVMAIVPKNNVKVTPKLAVVFPRLVPKVTPKQTVKVTPKLVVKTNPKVTPKLTVQVTPKLAVKVTPKLVGKITPSLSVKAAAKFPKLTQKPVVKHSKSVKNPDVTPKLAIVVLKLDPKDDPKLPPKVTPKIAVVLPKSTSKLITKSPQVITKSTPKVVTKSTPKVVTKSTPKMVEKMFPKVVSKLTPKVVTKLTPKVVTKLPPKMLTKLLPRETPNSKLAIQFAPKRAPMIPKMVKKAATKSTPKVVTNLSSNLLPKTEKKTLNLLQKPTQKTPIKPLPKLLIKNHRIAPKPTSKLAVLVLQLDPKEDPKLPPKLTPKLAVVLPKKTLQTPKLATITKPTSNLLSAIPRVIPAKNSSKLRPPLPKFTPIVKPKRIALLYPNVPTKKDLKSVIKSVPKQIVGVGPKLMATSPKPSIKVNNEVIPKSKLRIAPKPLLKLAPKLATVAAAKPVLQLVSKLPKSAPTKPAYIPVIPQASPVLASTPKKSSKYAILLVEIDPDNTTETKVISILNPVAKDLDLPTENLVRIPKSIPSPKTPKHKCPCGNHTHHYRWDKVIPKYIHLEDIRKTKLHPKPANSYRKSPNLATMITPKHRLAKPSEPAQNLGTKPSSKQISRPIPKLITKPLNHIFKSPNSYKLNPTESKVNPTVTRGSKRIPSESKKVPIESKRVPVESKGVLIESKGVPITPTVPIESKRVPTESKRIPNESKLISNRSKVIPNNLK